MTEGVKKFLYGLGMMQYYEMFMIKGFDDESDIPCLTSFDLKDTIMVDDQSHRHTILSHAHVYRPSSECAVHAWLCSNSLGYYFISFLQSDLNDLRKISQLSLPDEELYDELEIVLPGHRKRLERAVQRLKFEQINSAAEEAPISHGWWGKPECLPQAKFDFLCVKASIFSSHSPHNTATVDFMVDSGSDVSTVQEDTLKELNLELIGPVYSCGIHGGNHTNLYKGRLKIGDQELDIEVMGSNYDSLGSRVVRHFRHIIDGHQHIWLKGNYTDPLPAIIPIEFPVDVNSSQLSKQIGHKQAPLPITSGSNSKIEIVSENLNQVTRTPGISSNGWNSDTQHSDPKTVSTNNKALHTDKHQYSQTTRSASQIEISTPAGTQYLNPSSVQDSVTKTKNTLSTHPSLHSSANNQFYHNKHASYSAKGKLSMKSNRYDLIKSSLKKRRKISRSSLPKGSLQRFSHGISGSNSESSAVELNQGGCGSTENFMQKESHSESNVQSNERISVSNNLPSSVDERASFNNSLSPSVDERVSFSNNFPPSIRDTDDEVDYLEDSVIAKKEFPIIQISKMSEDSGIGMKQILHKEPNAQKESLKGGTCVTHEQTLNTYHQHQRADNCLTYDDYNVVHVDGLLDNVAYEDDDICSGNVSSVEVVGGGEKMEMNIIPACNNITVIHVDKTDVHRQVIKGDNYMITNAYTNNNINIIKDTYSEESVYESPRKLGRYTIDT